MLDLLVLNVPLSVLRDENRDHRKPLHDAADSEQHEVVRVVVARDATAAREDAHLIVAPIHEDGASADYS
jgi:hypothetical protein